MRREAVVIGSGVLLMIVAIWLFSSLALFGVGICSFIVGLVMVVGRIGASDIKGERYQHNEQ